MSHGEERTKLSDGDLPRKLRANLFAAIDSTVDDESLKADIVDHVFPAAWNFMAMSMIHTLNASVRGLRQGAIDHPELPTNLEFALSFMESLAHGMTHDLMPEPEVPTDD